MNQRILFSRTDVTHIVNRIFGCSYIIIVLFFSFVLLMIYREWKKWQVNSVSLPLGLRFKIENKRSREVLTRHKLKSRTKISSFFAIEPEKNEWNKETFMLFILKTPTESVLLKTTLVKLWVLKFQRPYFLLWFQVAGGSAGKEEEEKRFQQVPSNNNWLRSSEVALEQLYDRSQGGSQVKCDKATKCRGRRWVRKTSDFNSGNHFLFNFQQAVSIVFFNPDHIHL